MKLLVDQGMAPQCAGWLRVGGHDATHVRDYGMQRATDAEILDRAEAEGRVVVSLDTDFGTLLAMRRARKPSVILLRYWVGMRRPENQVAILLANLEAVEAALEEGAIVVFHNTRIRVRPLPIL